VKTHLTQTGGADTSARFSVSIRHENGDSLHYVTLLQQGGLRYRKFGTGLECVRQTALATVLAVFVERHLQSQSVNAVFVNSE
jgi:hypothetical protein